jgi:hypothetical protein
MESGVREFQARQPGLPLVTKPKPVKPQPLGQAPFLPPLTDTRKYHGRDDTDSSSDSSLGQDTSVSNFANALVENVFSQLAGGATSDSILTQSPLPLFHSSVLSGSESDISDSYKSGKNHRLPARGSGPDIDTVQNYVDRMFSRMTTGAHDASGAPSEEKYTYHFHSEGAEGHSPEVSRLEAPSDGNYLSQDYSHSSQDGASSSDISIDNINISLSQPLSGASMDSSSQSESCYPSHTYAYDTSSVGNFVDSFVNTVISSALQVTEHDHDQSDASSSSSLGRGDGAHNFQNASSVADRMVNQVFRDLRDEFEQSIPDSMKLLQSSSGSGSSGPYSSDHSHYPQIIVSHHYPSLVSYVDCLVTSAFEDAMSELLNMLPKRRIAASPEVVTFVDHLLFDSLFGAFRDLECRNFPVALETNSKKYTSNFLSVKPSSSSSSSLWSRSSFSSASTSSGDRSPGNGDRSPIVERPIIPGPSSQSPFDTRPRYMTRRRIKSQSFSDYSTGNIMDDIKSASIRRHCSLTGFFDPTLSRFAEELIHLDTSSPPLDIFSTSDSSMSSPRQQSSSSDGGFSQSPFVSSSSSGSPHTSDNKDKLGRKKSNEKSGAVGGSALRKQGMKPKSKKKSQSWHPSILQNKKKEKHAEKEPKKSKLVLELESYADNMIERIFDDAYYTIQYLWYEFWPYLPTDSDMSSSEKSFPIEDKKGKVNTLIKTYADQVTEKIMKGVFADHRVKRRSQKRIIWHWSEMSEYCDAMEVSYLDLEDFASTFVTCVIYESLQIVHGWKSEDSPALGAMLALFSRDQQRVDYYTKGDVWQVRNRLQL